MLVGPLKLRRSNVLLKDEQSPRCEGAGDLRHHMFQLQKVVEAVAGENHVIGVLRKRDAIHIGLAVAAVVAVLAVWQSRRVPPVRLKGAKVEPAVMAE